MTMAMVGKMVAYREKQDTKNPTVPRRGVVAAAATVPGVVAAAATVPLGGALAAPAPSFAASAFATPALAPALACRVTLS